MKTINSVLWITLFMLPSAFLFAGHPLSEINTTVKEFYAVTEQKKCTTDVPGIWTRDDTNPDHDGCRGNTNICYRLISPCVAANLIKAGMSGDGYTYNPDGKILRMSIVLIKKVEALGKIETVTPNTLEGSDSNMLLMFSDKDTGEVYRITFFSNEVLFNNGTPDLVILLWLWSEVPGNSPGGAG